MRVGWLRGAAIVLLVAAGCAPETIAHQQTEREANRIVKLLKDRGMEAAKVRDEESRELRFNVQIAKDDAHQALSILEEFNLPEEPEKSTADMFEEGGMIPTREQERAKREVGIAGDIVNALRSVDGVVNVQAAVSLPEDEQIPDPTVERPRPKVSVIVEYRGDGSKPPPLTKEEVQRFAASKVPRVKSTEVSVILKPSKTVVTGGGQGATGAAMPVVNPQTHCEKGRIVGLDVCATHKKTVINYLIGVFVGAAVLAAMAVLAILRALRYRKDLTRLTAQFQQHKR